ncbi:hypothetical protein, partial [Candidatus Methylobacter oryzae]|uniref:hypothetical protein n=1 Tax=Candidatus Methylobacter oryzae TaxID=2497749 RepID=UPI0019D5A091
RIDNPFFMPAGFVPASGNAEDILISKGISFVCADEPLNSALTAVISMGRRSLFCRSCRQILTQPAQSVVFNHL